MSFSGIFYEPVSLASSMTPLITYKTINMNILCRLTKTQTWKMGRTEGGTDEVWGKKKSHNDELHHLPSG